ncbi:MAG TPA: hypothetical protein VL947_01150 [Cytophagales bacterium]|nr:hypothetical protein [Cytophagales bacterium]
MKKLQLLFILLSLNVSHAQNNAVTEDKEYQLFKMMVHMVHTKSSSSIALIRPYVSPSEKIISTPRLNSLLHELVANHEAKLSDRQYIYYADEEKRAKSYHVALFSKIAYDYSKLPTEDYNQIKAVFSDIQVFNESKQLVYDKNAPKNNRINELDTVNLNSMGQVSNNLSIENKYKTKVYGNYLLELLAPAKYIETTVHKRDFDKPIIIEKDTLKPLTLDTNKRRLYIECNQTWPKGYDLKITNDHNNVNSSFSRIAVPKEIFDFAFRHPEATDEEMQVFFKRLDRGKIRTGPYILIIDTDVDITTLHFYKVVQYNKTPKATVQFVITDLYK